MRILVLGGTRCAGRAITEAALGRGDTVTLFNRGKTNPGLYPGIETVTGDRATDLAKLEGREWDAVIDVAGYDPEVDPGLGPSPRRPRPGGPVAGRRGQAAPRASGLRRRSSRTTARAAS